MKRGRQAARALVAAGIAVVGGDSSGGVQAGAQTSCTVSIAVANVHVASNSTYVVPGTLTQACGAVSASWDMQQGARLISSWFLWNGGSTPLSEGQSDKAYFFPSTNPLGTYQASPNSADDTNYDAIPQNSYQFSIKVNSRISISGYRSPKNVYVRARVSQFNLNANSVSAAGPTRRAAASSSIRTGVVGSASALKRPARTATPLTSRPLARPPNVSGDRQSDPDDLGPDFDGHFPVILTSLVETRSVLEGEYEKGHRRGCNCRHCDFRRGMR